MFINELHQRADQELKSGNIAEAILLYDRLIAEFPGNPDLHSDRGVAHLHQKNVTACFFDLDLAVNLQSDYAFRYACRAFAKNHFGDLEGAIVDYEKAVELDPDDAVAHNNLGLLFEQKGYKDEAQVRFDQADRLSKMEDQLYHVIEDIEDVKEPQNPEKQSATESQETKENESTLQGMKKVISSRTEFRNFIKFIKNGFRIK